jgi:hypothetical protein
VYERRLRLRWGVLSEPIPDGPERREVCPSHGGRLVESVRRLSDLLSRGQTFADVLERFHIQRVHPGERLCHPIGDPLARFRIPKPLGEVGTQRDRFAVEVRHDEERFAQNRLVVAVQNRVRRVQFGRVKSPHHRPLSL